MTLPGFPTITRDAEAELYALAAKRYRRRRMVSQALGYLRYFPVVSLLIVVLLEGR